MTWMLTGGTGILGSAFRKAIAPPVLVVIAHQELDITLSPAINDLLDNIKPAVVVNCAAHTDVEGAEDAPDLAYAANSILPGLLATACRRRGALLIHFSSTGCYGSWKEEAYTDEDEPSPMSIHHRSKIAGERAIRSSGCEHLILRTGWLFGGGAAHGKNFVWKRILEASRSESMTSDAAQRGNPTWADDVVRQSLTMIDDGLRGTFNVVATGTATRYEYVKAIIEMSGLPCRIEPGAAFARRAPVSLNEAASNYKLKLLKRNTMPDWRESLARYIGELQQSDEWESLSRPIKL